MNRPIAKSKVSSVFVLRLLFILLSIATVFGFLRHSLISQADSYVQDFYLQNSVDISQGEVFPLARKLGALAKKGQMICIYGTKEKNIFFEEKKSNCEAGVLQTQKSIHDKIQDIQIDFTIRMADELIVGFVVFILIQAILLVLMILGERKSILDRIRGEIEMAAIARQIGHDIRSPLAVLKYSLGLEKEIAPLQLSALQRLQDLSSHLLKKEEDLLHLGEVKTLLQGVAQEKKLEYGESINISFRDQIPPGFYLPGDAFFWRRIFSNLLNNSVEAKRWNQIKVQIGLEVENSELVIRISDDGVGFPAEFLNSMSQTIKIPNRVFGLESKLGTKGKSFGKKFGTGLGISSAKEFIEKQGGKFQISSSEGLGATIEILLPKLNHLVLIDDDPEFGEVWKLWAEKKGIPFSFHQWLGINQLSRLVEQIRKESIVFIDRQMGESLDYRKLSRELNGKGVSQLYLCTGDHDIDEPLPKEILGIVKKEPPVVEKSL